MQEKQKGRNKLVPRLLGVTKDSVLRLDEKTKEILKTWPLTTVRRWAASPNVFTLDFGDYQVHFQLAMMMMFYNFANIALVSGPVLQRADHRGRADIGADCRIYRHYPQEKTEEGEVWRGRE